jgi:drug/metabolite transporter (DMT)-like permease
MRPISTVAAGAAFEPLPFLIAAFCLLWSSAFAVAKLALADCPPLLLLTARFLLAGLVIVGAAAVNGARWHLGGRDLLVLAVFGIANNALYLGLSYLGMRDVSAGLSAIIISANPVLTSALAAFFLKEPMTWRKAAGLLLAAAGVALIVESRVGSGSDSPAGIGFLAGALLAIVTGTILFKRLAPKGGLWIGNGVQNLVGGLALAPFALTFEGVSQITPSWKLLIALAYLVLMVSVLGYLLWFHLLTISSATAASAYHFLMPPLGLFFGWLLLGERIEAIDLVGIVPVALGIYLVTRPPRRGTAKAG